MIMSNISPEALTAGVSAVKDAMGILFNDDDKMIEDKLNISAFWLTNEILYEPDFVIQPLSTELTLICERVRYEMSNSLDIFQKNYGQDIQNVISRHAYNDFMSKQGGV